MDARGEFNYVPDGVSSWSNSTTRMDARGEFNYASSSETRGNSTTMTRMYARGEFNHIPDNATNVNGGSTSLTSLDALGEFNYPPDGAEKKVKADSRTITIPTEIGADGKVELKASGTKGAGLIGLGVSHLKTPEGARRKRRHARKGAETTPSHQRLIPHLPEEGRMNDTTITKIICEVLH